MKKLSVISEGYSFNADVEGNEIAIINLRSFISEDRVDVAEIVASREAIAEIIRMLEQVSDLLV
ncbi:hypothetical protein [Sporosarcina sp. FSL K6-1508]|uniref:hypothetical protein n=1 Tax=Sporosarcina sp. FSL K6-1508 TaxID=2921553 RepID=UPI0030F6A076